jgi:hypothetical protein
MKISISIFQAWILLSLSFSTHWTSKQVAMIVIRTMLKNKDSKLQSLWMNTYNMQFKISFFQVLDFDTMLEIDSESMR